MDMSIGHAIAHYTDTWQDWQAQSGRCAQCVPCSIEELMQQSALAGGR